jgi:hypothetical protein
LNPRKNVGKTETIEELKEFSGEGDSIPESNFKQLRNEDIKKISRGDLGRKGFSYKANEMYM